MKKIILSVLALGLSMGLMAQKVYNGAEPMKGQLKNSPKTSGLIYPESFQDCGSIDDPKFYVADGQSIYKAMTGTNSYGDQAYGQRYVGNYQVTGIAAVMSNYSIDGTEEDMAAAIIDMNGNELALVEFTTADIPQMGEDAEGYLDLAFDLVEFNFSAPVSANDFLAAIYVPLLTVTSDNQLGGNIVAIASTEMGCWSDDMSYSYSVLSEGADYEWVSIYEAWGGAQGGVELDCMIFPKVSGTGLTEADVETLSYIFPNPAKDEVMVASSLTMERVEIVNMLGQVVFAADVNGNSVKVNTAEMGAGNYLVKMYTEAGMATKKLVVE
ncbi:MAG: T9SS type A sorting domain-containing protein [Bacteroidales bacterium]|nr:T9SS type A sorting domain-containing protein [Bacteroidales bacterium]